MFPSRRPTVHPRARSAALPSVALPLAALLVAAGAAKAPAQTTSSDPDPPETRGWTEESPFRPLDLPAANRLRTGAGRPGPDYWQQRVDYRLAATLDTAGPLLTGRGVMVYHNRSPEALPFLWLKIDANLCDPEGVTARLAQPPLRFGDAVFDFGCRGGAGMTVERIAVGGRPATVHPAGTRMRVDLPAPLAPGDSVAVELAWTWPLPEYGYGRMGRDGSLFQVAQWYPRAAVYDDLGGWHVDPFLGAGEFYQEFGRFEVDLTVPAGYVVTATGTLRNPDEVLTAAQRERLARADGSEQAVAVITREEALAARDRPVPGTRTWRFAADDVRDFAFALAPDFRWDASSWEGIRIQTFYRPEATSWEEANRMSLVSIRNFSERLARYPWPHATTVEGPNEGMEYPMLTFVPGYDDREDLYWVLTHEFGHEWYPMLVASNERRHPWMDEGFNTFIDIGSVEEFFAGEDYADWISRQPLEEWDLHSRAETDQAMALPPTEQHDLYWAAYFKPALMLHLLRTEVLGTERFDRAFAEYTQAWSFRHPGPADFLRFMEDATGEDLDWFWRGWLFTPARLDHAVEAVYPGGGDAERPAWVHLRSRGRMLMPVELRLTWADGGADILRLPVEMWKLGPDYVFRGPPGRVLAAVELDPRGVLPDDDRSNDAWKR
ncbi:MAG: M1 family metallopeptidase [Gemmatimonadota bacterium]|nr:M1 family metallopeptidase [Gemmatimonadota bacterium]